MRSWPLPFGLALLVAGGCARCSKPASTLDAGGDVAWLEGRWVERDAGAPRRGGELSVRVAVEPAGFSRVHDRLVDGTTARATTGTIYECLARVDPTRPESLVPWLARSWALDGRSLLVTLEPGVLFHDGSTFDANDVKAVLDAVIDARNPTVGARTSIGPPTAIELVDEATIRVVWAERPSSLVVRSLLSSVPMMPSEKLVGAFDTLELHRAPVGTGPFSLKSFTPGQGYVVERFARHRSPAWLDAVRFRVVTDDTLAVQLWASGEFDLMTRIPPAVWRDTEGQAWARSGYQRIRLDENAYAWIGWNQARPVFSDVRVRRALAMLYPAPAVARAVELDLERRTTCPFWVDSASCDPSVQPLPFDPARAATLLDEAGWVDSNGDGVRERGSAQLEFSFLLVSTSARLNRVAALFQEQLALAGVRMTLEPVDAAQSIARMRAHDFDAAALIWSSPDVVTDQFDIFHSSQVDGGKNFVGVANAEIDRLLEQIRAENDGVQRQTLERALHRRLFDEQVYLFLTARPALDAAKRRVHGLVPSIAGYDFARVWVDL